jgi:hypothetical protein
MANRAGRPGFHEPADPPQRERSHRAIARELLDDAPRAPARLGDLRERKVL